MIKNHFLIFSCFFLLQTHFTFSQYNRGRITGDGVSLRTGHTTTSAKITSLFLNENVTILDYYMPADNHGEAILKYKYDFYDRAGNYLFSLQKGKAVEVLYNVDENTLATSYKNANGKTGFANISSYQLDFINGEKWYKVRTNQNKTGWVFGKYVQEIY